VLINGFRLLHFTVMNNGRFWANLNRKTNAHSYPANRMFNKIWFMACSNIQCSWVDNKNRRGSDKLRVLRVWFRVIISIFMQSDGIFKVVGTGSSPSTVCPLHPSSWPAEWRMKKSGWQLTLWQRWQTTASSGDSFQGNLSNEIRALLTNLSQTITPPVFLINWKS
jgi:hypothetical protein